MEDSLPACVAPGSTKIATLQHDHGMLERATARKLFTLVFVVEQPEGEKANSGGRVLLGYKKRGFGSGRFNGFGGKVEANETIAEAAARELHEESGLTAVDMNHRALIHFQFEHHPELLFEVHVFVVCKFHGSITETEEMRPQWFPIPDLPLRSMWPDDSSWLPLLLAGYATAPSGVPACDCEIRSSYSSTVNEIQHDMLLAYFLFRGESVIVDFEIERVPDESCFVGHRFAGLPRSFASLQSFPTEPVGDAISKSACPA